MKKNTHLKNHLRRLPLLPPPSASSSRPRFFVGAGDARTVNGIVWFLLELADAAWALITTVMGDLYRLDGNKVGGGNRGM